MLAGVAGRTIEEARERMPAEELPIWQAYMAKNGPLAMQRRIEYIGAQIAMILANQNRSEKSPPLGLERFLMWQRFEEPTEEGDEVSQVLSELKRVAAPPKDDAPRKRLWRRRSGA